MTVIDCDELAQLDGYRDLRDMLIERLKERGEW
jgi:hypothetical protein